MFQRRVIHASGKNLTNKPKNVCLPGVSISEMSLYLIAALSHGGFPADSGHGEAMRPHFITLILVSSCGFVGCSKAGFVALSSNSVSGDSASGGVPNSPAPAAGPTATPRPSSAANISVCPAGTAEAGVDVSNYDPATQWSTVSHGGVGFAFIKATEGIDINNSYFSSDWESSRAASVLRGAYHFFHPGDDPTTQAQFYLNTVGPFASDDLPPMLDWEVTDGVSAAVQIQKAMTWLSLVEAATGKVPVIYVDPSFFNALGNPTQFARYPLFIANYGVSCPDVPPPWTTWTFWQKGSGPVAGVANTADEDEFNGSFEELQAFAALN